MDFHDKLTAFAITEAGWIMWLLLGFSMGGLAVVLQRALYLVTTTRRFRNLTARIARRRHPARHVPALCGC